MHGDGSGVMEHRLLSWEKYEQSSPFCGKSEF